MNPYSRNQYLKQKIPFGLFLKNFTTFVVNNDTLCIQKKDNRPKTILLE